MFGVIGMLRGRDETTSTMTDASEVKGNNVEPGITGRLVGKLSGSENCLCEEEAAPTGGRFVVGKLLDRLWVDWLATRLAGCVDVDVGIPGGVFAESQRP